MLVLNFKGMIMFQRILLLSSISFLISGCGGGSKDRVMEIGQSYSVSKGDLVVKASDTALIKILHVDGKDTSTVSLLDGNATITHPKK